MKFIHFQIAALVAVLSAGGLCAQATYNAVTDRVMRPYPATPTMGPAGTIVNRSSLRQSDLRVTDSSTYPDYPSAGCDTPSAAMTNSWNSKQHVVYRAVRWRRIHLAVYVQPHDDESQPHQPHQFGLGRSLAGLKGGQFQFYRPECDLRAWRECSPERSIVWSYNFATNDYTPIFDVRTTVPAGTDTNTGSSSVSANGYFTTTFSGIQDTFRYVLWLNMNTGSYKLLDAVTATVKRESGDVRRPGSRLRHALREYR